MSASTRHAPRPLLRLAAAAASVLVLGVAACTSGDDDADTSAGVEEVDTPPATGPEEPTLRPCTDGPSLDEVTAVPGEAEGDVVVTSFDGTEILAHWFPSPASAEEPAPSILMGPGWSLPGDTSRDDALPLFGALSITALNDAGYNVLTWDPRGFHGSGGTSMVNDPEVEGRDVQALLDWVAEQPEAGSTARATPAAAWWASPTEEASSSRSAAATAGSTPSSPAWRGTRWSRACSSPAPPSWGGPRRSRPPRPGPGSTRTSPAPVSRPRPTARSATRTSPGSASGARATSSRTSRCRPSSSTAPPTPSSPSTRP